LTYPDGIVNFFRNSLDTDDLHIVCQERTLKQSVRNCAKDEGWLAPRSRLTGAGFKPPKAALVKSQGGERLGKVTA